jgi:hypothetical protein
LAVRHHGSTSLPLKLATGLVSSRRSLNFQTVGWLLEVPR